MFGENKSPGEHDTNFKIWVNDLQNVFYDTQVP